MSRRIVTWAASQGTRRRKERLEATSPLGVLSRPSLFLLPPLPSTTSRCNAVVLVILHLLQVRYTEIQLLPGETCFKPSIGAFKATRLFDFCQVFWCR
ncbi:hypothetical protein BT69DRAFT_865639 [Atractiella rhizophila]|nr:hypothetical protein BT69DRAFT_865639 [Atractiella rhizophila]